MSYFMSLKKPQQEKKACINGDCFAKESKELKGVTGKSEKGKKEKPFQEHAIELITTVDKLRHAVGLLRTCV